jgi:hypothetical protein
VTASPKAWTKRGLVLEPDPRIAWMATHTALPTPLTRNGQLELYVAGRNDAGYGQTGRCRVSFDTGHPVATAEAPTPLVPVGPLGAFDDCGATVSQVLEHQGLFYLYYTGWTRVETVGFHLFAGLAISDDGGASFTKVSPAPILERTAGDPFMTISGAVLIDGGVWRMWYASCSEWKRVDGKPRHYYRIKYAESRDGVVWRRDDRVCIDYASPDEYAIARPWVVKDGNRYRMWFSHRGESYRIGYAESDDGLSWERLDARVGIDVSASGWDSEMVEYPAVIESGGQEWMFYNGNGYGRTGVGWAVRPGRATP